MCNPDNANMTRTKEEMRIDETNGSDSIVPIEIWYSRLFTYQGEGVGEFLHLIWEVIPRWWKCNFMRDFCWELRQSSSLWKIVGTSRWLKEL